jgi:hypothetical protein
MWHVDGDEGDAWLCDDCYSRVGPDLFPSNN